MRELEEKLREKLGENLEAQIKGEIANFGGLLTRQAAIVLLCKKNGINIEKRIRLSEASSMSLPFSFEAKVDRVFPMQFYSGKTDRSVRLHISDESGSATLVAWNELADAVEKGEICAGDRIECSGAYFRFGEITLGKEGKMRKLESAKIPSLESLPEGICNVEGEVREIEPDYRYIDRKSGKEKAFRSFILQQKPGIFKRVVAWQMQSLPQILPGDWIFLENVLHKNGELHFNSYSRAILRKKEKEALVEKIEVGKEQSLFFIGGKKYEAKNDEAMRLLGIQGLAGVSDKAVIEIKARQLIGKKARYREEGGKLASLVVMQQE